MRTHAQTPFTRLLEDYCRSVGMGDFEIDPEGGIFELKDVMVIVRHDVEFDRVAMVAHVATLPVGKLGALSPNLLQLNSALALSGGQAFCADMENGDVHLQQSLSLKGLAADELDEQLMTIAEKCHAARELLAKLEGVAETAHPRPREEDRIDPTFMSFRV